MAQAPQAGDTAPAFDMATDTGNVSLAGLKGRAVLLYFYPKDDTTGCTNEANAFTAAQADFDKAGAVIVGVSKDSAASHAKFRKKYGLTIELGSDPEGAVVESYGVWVSKSMYGRSYMGIERATFLIDGEGIVRRVWHKVKVPGHAAEVLAAVQALNGG
ncbi:MAG: alkyl hydroperoxide reductase [Caulobacter sp.]|nr:alkyl hydroperoxide reductase [Caulobacter sp.]